MLSPVVSKMEISTKQQHSNDVRDVLHILCDFLPNVVVESLKRSVQSVNGITQSLFQILILLCWIYAPKCPH